MRHNYDNQIVYLQVVKPVEARCPIPKAPDPGFLKKPAPVFDPGGRGFWMKLTTICVSDAKKMVILA